MLAMPIAGQLTDKTGVGRIVPFGLLAVGIGFAGLTQIGARHRLTGCSRCRCSSWASGWASA